MPLIRFIAPTARTDYRARMTGLLLRVLAAVAVLLMPLSMAAASAPVQATGASSEHCDDHGKPADVPSEHKVHCTACAGLPAMEAPVQMPDLLPVPQLVIRAVHSLAGITPETATPPPKA